MSNKHTPLLDQRPTINPYKNAVAEVFRRLLWDLHPESWASRKKMKGYLDIHRGKSAVILCNGPSLLKSDLSILDGVETFGLNKINLLYKNNSFRPSYIVSVNKYVNEQNSEYFRESNIPLFLHYSALHQVGSRNNTCYLYPSPQQKFARDCSMSIHEGYTVTFVAMQLAYHMGFTRVALIGCDHNFVQSGPANQTVVAGKDDPSHFDPSYFSGGVKWQLPDLLQSEVSYSMARDIFAGSDRLLVNCTVGGRLDLLPRMSLEDFLAGENPTR